MKIDKKKALLMSNVIFLRLNDDKCSDFRVDLEDLYAELNDYILSGDKTESAKVEPVRTVSKVNTPKFDEIISAIELHDLEFFSGLEFECDEDNGDVSLLVDGYAERSGITAIKRTTKSLQIHCGDVMHEHKISKKSIPDDWKSLLPLNSLVGVKF